MVKWQGRQGSRNVGFKSGGGRGLGGAAVANLGGFVLRRFGVTGVVIAVLAILGLRAVGVDPLGLFGGQSTTHQRAMASDTEKFIAVILRETEVAWGQVFAKHGETYPEPRLNIFSGQVSSACGYATAAVGPFYCPGDREIYLDTQFFAELSQRFGAPGDFAAAYVIAHEVGHHVQTVTGTAEQFRSRGSKSEQNALSVRQELQADCYAGIWAHHADRTAKILEAGDIEEGLRAAAAIGDDTLQRNAGQRVSPESFTHGSSEQRVRWFQIGYRSGRVEDCDTSGNRPL